VQVNLTPLGVRRHSNTTRSENHENWSSANSSKKTIPPYDWRAGSSDQHERWLSILEDYSHRSLTRSRDRLPAIAGIAERVESLYGDKYVAGIFRSALPDCLLWRGVSDLEGRRQFLKPASVPTTPRWSWASVIDALDFDACATIRGWNHARVLDVTSHPQAHESATGEALPAQIKLSGPFVSISRLSMKQGRWPNDFFAFKVQGLAAKKHKILLDTNIAVPMWTTFFLFVIRHRLKTLDREYEQLSNEIGLVLIPSPGDGTQYVRVGIFFNDSWDDEDGGHVYQNCQTVVLV
jgi:hypothetical protein